MKLINFQSINFCCCEFKTTHKLALLRRKAVYTISVKIENLSVPMKLLITGEFYDYFIVETEKNCKEFAFIF